MHYWVRYHGFFSQKKSFSSNFSYVVVTFFKNFNFIFYLCGHAFPFAAKINVLNYFNLLNELNSNKNDYLLQAFILLTKKEKKGKKSWQNE